MRRIGIVGVGLLGSSVALRLLQSGFEVTGYDTRREQIEATWPQGLKAAATIAEATMGADAVFTILPSLESVEVVICGPGGLIETAPSKAILLQMSTISPDLTRRLHKATSAKGPGFLDAPISGTSAMVARGDCTILVGGDPEHVRICLPVFEAITSRTVHVGNVGMASLAKLVTNLLVGLNTAALAEALVLGAKGGLDPAKALEALEGTAASSRMMEIRGPLMVAEEARTLLERPPVDTRGGAPPGGPSPPYDHCPEAFRRRRRRRSGCPGPRRSHNNTQAPGRPHPPASIKKTHNSCCLNCEVKVTSNFVWKPSSS